MFGGAPAEFIEQAMSEPDEFEVWPENESALEIFCRLGTQWKVGALGGFLGLDYSGVLALFDLLGVENRKEMFDKVQDMERAALPVLNTRGK